MTDEEYDRWYKEMNRILRLPENMKQIQAMLARAKAKQKDAK